MYNKSGKKTALTIANDLYTISHSHVGKNNYLYRIFYYDCVPFAKKIHNPVSVSYTHLTLPTIRLV